MNIVTKLIYNDIINVHGVFLIISALSMILKSVSIKCFNMVFPYMNESS